MQGTISRVQNCIRWDARFAATRDCLAAVFGIVALGASAVAWEFTEPAEIAGAEILAMAGPSGNSSATGTTSPATGATTRAGTEILAGAYFGTARTHPSTVAIKNPGRTDMTVRDFQWEGKPFKSPIYYGARVVAWPDNARVGAMLDFTHAKAIARFDDTGTFTGTHEGKPLPSKARVGDVFKHLEFSHGHNMLTVNALTRLGRFAVQPYVGAGAGISLPHTEVAFRTENGRTYEYQYAGLVGQALAGIEVKLGRATVFLEYKFTYAPYEVPLSGVVNGWLLVTDVWRQLKAWISGETPPAGRLTTTLMTHHTVGGVLVRATPAAAVR